jgi:hypothetical protein
MPVQSAVPLVVIAGAFIVANACIAGCNWLETGNSQKQIGQSHWSAKLEDRDRILKYKFGIDVDKKF